MLAGKDVQERVRCARKAGLIVIVNRTLLPTVQ